MKLFSAYRRLIARTSLSRAIPSLAFLLTFFLGTAFTIVHMVGAKNSYNRVIEAEGFRLASALSHDFERSDLQIVQNTLDKHAPAGATLVLEDGTEIQSRRGALKGATDYPVALNNGGTATLRYGPQAPYRGHLTLPQMFSLILLCALFASGVMWFISNAIVRYLGELSRFLEKFSLDSTKVKMFPSLNFAEFRILNAAARRTTRRLTLEVDALRERAAIDDRTGLYNEYYLKTKVEATLETVKYDQPAALLLINVDGLYDLSMRIIGTQYTSLLTDIGQELLDCKRQAASEAGQSPDDWTLACLPNDQYAMLATGFSSRDDVAPLVRRIHARLREFSSEKDLSVQLKASGSIVMLPEDGDTHPVIMQRAETTLQSLRAQNSGGFRFYSPKLERQTESRARLESELRSAVDEERFVPLFQPKIDLKTGKICGVEALARWQLDSGRLVSPAVFVSLAEEIGLIDKIGKQIMQRSCNAAAAWARDGYRLNLAVNVSPRQFESDDLAGMVLEALTSSGLSPRQLELEITESLAIEQPERVRSVLTPLRKMGIRLAVDDFGTGHSNLAILTQFEFDVFKIDRQFVSGLPNDSQSIAIIDLMLGMGKSLNMQIVGEGIETQAQAKFMAARGCHIAQGFLYSPPVTEVALRKMLEDEAVLLHRRTA